MQGKGEDADGVDEIELRPLLPLFKHDGIGKSFEAKRTLAKQTLSQRLLGIAAKVSKEPQDR